MSLENALANSSLASQTNFIGTVSLLRCAQQLVTGPYSGPDNSDHGFTFHLRLILLLSSHLGLSPTS